MKITEKLAAFQAANGSEPFFSIEFFPPKTEEGVKNLEARFERYHAEGPLFADMTWGAGGSTSDLTVSLCLKMQQQGLESNMHLTCTNMERSKLDRALEEAKAGGIRNIVALRGDPPVGQEWQAVEGGFTCARDLVKHIRAVYGDHFCISVAGYPEGHVSTIKPVEDEAKLTESERGRLVRLPEGIFVCSDESYQKEIDYLVSKVAAGADLIITQMIFDASVYTTFVRDCRAAGITVPIIPGIMCVSVYPGFLRMTSFCRSRVPDAFRAQLEAAKDSEAELKQASIAAGAQLCRDLIAAGAPGVHLYTLNLDKVSMGIMQEMKFIKSA